MNKERSMIPYLLLLYAIWGFNWVVMRIANDYFPPLYFSTCRFIIGAGVLLLICALRGRLIPPRKYWKWLIISGFFCMGVNMGMVQVCTKYIGAGLTAVLDYTQSIFVCILAAIFLGEPFTRRKLLGIILSFAGLLIVTGAEKPEHLWAVLLALGAAAIWAVSSLIVKWKLSDCDMLQVTGWQMAFGAGSLALSCVLFSQTPVPLTPLSFLALLYNGLVASALAWLLFNYVLIHMDAGKTSIAVMAIPAVGVLSGIIVLGEPMTPLIACGMLILLLGILIVLGLGEKKTA